MYLYFKVGIWMCSWYVYVEFVSGYVEFVRWVWSFCGHHGCESS